MIHRVRVCIVLLAVLLAAACQSLPPAAPTAVAPTAESSALSPIAPPPDEPGAASPDAAPAGRFAIDRPVQAGATLVQGSGLAGTAIALYDLTNMGVELGGGVVGDDGRFALQVAPLTGNLRIGIQLVEPNDAIWAEKTLLGPEALVVPMVGAFVDTVLVSP